MRHLTTYVALTDHSEQVLAQSLRTVGDGHSATVDVFHTCAMLAAWSEGHRTDLLPVVERYGEADEDDEPERLRTAALPAVRAGEIGLLRDLQDLLVLTGLVHTCWVVLAQAAQGLRDRDLLEICSRAQTHTERQHSWLTTRIKAEAPQALLIPPPSRR